MDARGGVWAFGGGLSGALGCGSARDAWEPEQILSLRGLIAVGVAAGDGVSLVSELHAVETFVQF